MMSMMRARGSQQGTAAAARLLALLLLLHTVRHTQSLLPPGGSSGAAASVAAASSAAAAAAPHAAPAALGAKRRRPAFFTDPSLDRSGREQLQEPDALAAALASPECRVLPVQQGKSPVMHSTDGTASIHTISGAEAAALLQQQHPTSAPPTLIHLGSRGGHRYLALALPPGGAECAVPSAALWSDLRSVAELLSCDEDTGLLGLAHAMAAFHGATRFCPACGTATAPYKLGSGRKCTGEGCGTVHYPRVDPAMIVLVLSSDGSHALLGRKRAWPPGRYSCLAGFTELCESLEQTVVREVQEEAGIAVDPATVAFASSQPWPFPRQLMAGFVARAHGGGGGGALPAPVVDTRELEAAQWFTREQVAVALRADGACGELHFPSRASLARRLLQEWAGGAAPQRRSAVRGLARKV